MNAVPGIPSARGKLEAGKRVGRMTKVVADLRIERPSRVIEAVAQSGAREEDLVLQQYGRRRVHGLVVDAGRVIEAVLQRRSLNLQLFGQLPGLVRVAGDQRSVAVVERQRRAIAVKRSRRIETSPAEPNSLNNPRESY